MTPAPTPREYLLRITRLPLSDERRELLAREGRLPDDFRTRSVPATDFIRLHARSDEEARTMALEQVHLRFAGESACVSEVGAPGSDRELVPEVTDEELWMLDKPPYPWDEMSIEPG